MFNSIRAKLVSHLHQGIPDESVPIFKSTGVNGLFPQSLKQLVAHSLIICPQSVA